MSEFLIIFFVLQTQKETSCIFYFCWKNVLL